MVYARDIKPELLNDDFFGKGFEEALKKAESDGYELEVGTYHKKWKVV